MKLNITTHDCINAKGFTSSTNPVAVAFKTTHPDLDQVETSHNRLTAMKDGYPLRFIIQGFTPSDYRDLIQGTKQVCTCILKPQPIRL